MTLTAELSFNGGVPGCGDAASFGDLRVHAGIFVVFIAAAVFTVLFKSSRWGYETMVIGSNPAAARYAGMDIARNVLIAMFISGAVCGLAGMVEVSGIVGKLQHGISPGYGYTAIIIAWLARLNPPAIIWYLFCLRLFTWAALCCKPWAFPQRRQPCCRARCCFSWSVRKFLPATSCVL